MEAADSMRTILGRYRYNVALAQIFYPALHYLEVALRNHLDRALSAQFKTVNWSAVPKLLETRELDMIARARSKLSDRGVPHPLPEQIVAELEFGFWTSLFGTAYEKPHRLWPMLLKTSFPGMPRKIRTRKELARRLNDIRHLRNRIFHHEPIWNRGDPQAKYHRVCEALSWLDPALLRLFPSAVDLNDVCVRGPTFYEVDVDS